VDFLYHNPHGFAGQCEMNKTYLTIPAENSLTHVSKPVNRAYQFLATNQQGTPPFGSSAKREINQAP
jgi:hypothetical protein